MGALIERVLLGRVLSAAIVAAFIAAMLIFVRWALKSDKQFRLIFSIVLVISVIVTVVMGIDLSKIVLDVQKKDYITYQGDYIERGGGQKDLKTVVVYDDQGKEIKLLRAGPSKTGTYEGTVIYGKRSKVVVEYSGSPKPD